MRDGVAMNNGAKRRTDGPEKDGVRKFRAFLPVTGRALIHAAVNLRCRGKAISVAPGRAAASGGPAECSDNHLAIPSIIRSFASQ